MTTPHHLRCDWLEEARMRLLGQAIIFHDELFVKVITMNDVIGELKKERKGCYDANSTLQPKPGHCGHECVCPVFKSTLQHKNSKECLKNSIGWEECIHDTRKQPSAEQRIEEIIKDLKEWEMRVVVPSDTLDFQYAVIPADEFEKKLESLLRGERG